MRINYLDFLKAAAIFGVVVIHTVSDTVVLYNTSSPTWWIAHGYDSLVRWTVPMFFMVSGSLMLASKRDCTIKEFYQTRVWKLLVPLFAWSVIYYLVQGRLGVYADPLSIGTFVVLFLKGEVFGRLWFLYSLLGLYLMTPFLKTFVQNATQGQLRAFLGVWFIYTSLDGILREFLEIELAVDLSYIYGYIGFYVLGYYLRKFAVAKYLRLFFGLAVISLAVTFLGAYGWSETTGDFNDYFYSFLSPHVIIIAVFIFILAKTKFNRSIPLIRKLSENSLGIYLIHSLVIEAMKMAGVTLPFFHPLTIVPVVAIVVTLISLMISMVIRALPGVRWVLP